MAKDRTQYLIDTNQGYFLGLVEKSANIPGQELRVTPQEIITEAIASYLIKRNGNGPIRRGHEFRRGVREQIYGKIAFYLIDVNHQHDDTRTDNINPFVNEEDYLERHNHPVVEDPIAVSAGEINVDSWIKSERAHASKSGLDALIAAEEEIRVA